MFRSHLLSRFTSCRSCDQLCTGEVAQQMGKFISIRQTCSHCGYIWLWNSQPFLKNISAGNILLSAGILFSDFTQTKVLHFLKCLRVIRITNRTFHLHQTEYLEPSILSVWSSKQQQLISTYELHLQLVVMEELMVQDTYQNMAPTE